MSRLSSSLATTAGLFAGDHGEAGPKSHRANKAAAGGKPAHRRAGSVRAPSAVAGLHTTKQGRCQKEKKTAKRTLPGVFVMDRTGAGTAPAHQGAHVTRIVQCVVSHLMNLVSR